MATPTVDMERVTEPKPQGRGPSTLAGPPIPCPISPPGHSPITAPSPAMTNAYSDHISLDIASDPPPPPSPPFPTLSSRPPRKHRISCYSFLVCLFNSLSTTMILAAAMLIVLAGSLANMEDIAGMDPLLRGLPSAMSLYSFFTIFTMVVGIVAYLLDSTWFAMFYSSLLTCLLLGQALYTDRISHHLPRRMSSLTAHWNELPPLGRDIVQVLGNCCGYAALEDRPGKVCPEDADHGCRYQIKEVGRNLNNLFRGAFLANLLVFATMAILLFLIVIYRA